MACQLPPIAKFLQSKAPLQKLPQRYEKWSCSRWSTWAGTTWTL